MNVPAFTTMNKIRLQPHIILIALNVAIFLLQESGFDWRTEGALWQPEHPNNPVWQRNHPDK